MMSNEIVFSYQIGSEYAPDDPIGHETVRLDLNGQLFYERQQRGQVWRKVAQLEGSEQDRLNRAIAEAKAVLVPQHPLPPGATLVQIGFSEQQVLLDYFEAKKLHGYKRIIQFMDDQLPTFRENS